MSHKYDCMSACYVCVCVCEGERGSGVMDDNWCGVEDGDEWRHGRKIKTFPGFELKYMEVNDYRSRIWSSVM